MLMRSPVNHLFFQGSTQYAGIERRPPCDFDRRDGAAQDVVREPLSHLFRQGRRLDLVACLPGDIAARERVYLTRSRRLASIIQNNATGGAGEIGLEAVLTRFAGIWR